MRRFRTIIGRFKSSETDTPDKGTGPDANANRERKGQKIWPEDLKSVFERLLEKRQARRDKYCARHERGNCTKTKVRARENYENGESSDQTCDERARNYDNGCAGSEKELGPPSKNTCPVGRRLIKRHWETGVLILCRDVTDEY